MNAAAEPREIISPEGVEERVIEEQGVRVTLTGWGKYRVYLTSSDKVTSVRILDTKEEARKEAGMLLAVVGGFLSDPARMIDALLGGIAKS